MKRSNRGKVLKSSSKHSSANLAIVKEALRQRNEQLVKAIASARDENKRLEELATSIKKENFEYELRNNRLINMFSNIDAIMKNSSGKLVQLSENTCEVLQLCGTVKLMGKRSTGITNEVPRTPTTSMPPSSARKELRSSGNKTHVVKPHTVNGHILYMPTINLNRVTEPNISHHNLSNCEEEDRENEEVAQATSNIRLNRTSRVSVIQTNETSDESEDEHSEGDSEENNRMSSSGRNVDLRRFLSREGLYQVDDPNQPSTSSQHSTVLSGTFQEVKIYLNQIKKDTLEQVTKRSRGSSVTLRKRIKTERASPSDS